VVSEVVPLPSRSNAMCPLPYDVDWSATTDIQSAAEVVDGQWHLTGSGIRTTTPGYDRLVAIGDVAWTDYEITVPVTVHAVDFAGAGGNSAAPGLGVISRWRGHTDDPTTAWGWTQPKAGWVPNGNIGWWRFHSATDVNLEWFEPATHVPFVPALDVTYQFKQRVETQPDGSNLYRMKVWEASQPEPSEWTLGITEGSGDLPSGSLLLVAHHVDATFGDVSVVPVTDAGTPSETEPPPDEEPAPSAGVMSDGFDSTSLDPMWTVVDPVGDGSVSVDGSRLVLAVPEGTDHDVWTGGNRALRVMQPVADGDFDVQLRFESGVSGDHQVHGLLVEASPGNFLRFDFVSASGRTYLFVASFVDGVPTVRRQLDVAPQGVAPLRLRAQRTGDEWSVRYSLDDGVTWALGSQFSHVLAVSSLGPFVGNAGSNPAHTVLVDHVIDAADPLG
jgi:hypothetical protein